MGSWRDPHAEMRSTWKSVSFIWIIGWKFAYAVDLLISYVYLKIDVERARIRKSHLRCLIKDDDPCEGQVGTWKGPRRQLEVAEYITKWRWTRRGHSGRCTWRSWLSSSGPSEEPTHIPAWVFEYPWSREHVCSRRTSSSTMKSEMFAPFLPVSLRLHSPQGEREIVRRGLEAGGKVKTLTGTSQPQLREEQSTLNYIWGLSCKLYLILLDWLVLYLKLAVKWYFSWNVIKGKERKIW